MRKFIQIETMRFRHIILIGFYFMLVSFKPDHSLYKVSDGDINFISNAPLEIIEAQSESLIGLLSTENQSFAFSVNINTFHGFNSPLQEEHFNENYLESDKFEKATFTGTIIEEIDFAKYGVSIVRAKGKLTIHGVTNIIIIEVQLDIQEDKVEVASEFTILLEDYEISIPRIVTKKIAESIQISVNAVLENK